MVGLNKLWFSINTCLHIIAVKKAYFTTVSFWNTIMNSLIVSLDNYYDSIMAEAAAAGRSLAGKRGRLKWTDKMNQDLLECREKAFSLKSSSNPPCYQNVRLPWQ